MDTPESHRVRAFMSARPDGFGDLEEAAEAVHVYNPARAPRFTRRSEAQSRPGADGRWRWHWDPRILDGAIDMTAMACRLRAAAKVITVPTPLVRGSRSQMVDDEAGPSSAASCPNYRWPTSPAQATWWQGMTMTALPMPCVTSCTKRSL